MKCIAIGRHSHLVRRLLNGGRTMRARSYDDDDNGYENEHDSMGDDPQAAMLAELEALVELGSLRVS
jgi:hypothetical protein